MKIPYWTMCKIGPFIEMDLLWLSFETFAIWAYDIILWAVLMFFKLWTQTISLEDYIISNRTYFLRCISDIFLGHPIFEFTYIWPSSISLQKSWFWLFLNNCFTFISLILAGGLYLSPIMSCLFSYFFVAASCMQI